MSGGNGKAGVDEERGGLPAGLTADVRALIEMMARGGIADLTLETGAVKLRLRSHGAGARPAAEARPITGAALDGSRTATAPDMEPDSIVITAPMLGTFYHAPAPGEPPFVQVGDPVDAGQTIGIIEAMKIMNEIPIDASGVVAEIFVTNGQPVEYGQPLMRLVPPPGE